MLRLHADMIRHITFFADMKTTANLAATWKGAYAALSETPANAENRCAILSPTNHFLQLLVDRDIPKIKAMLAAAKKNQTLEALLCRRGRVTDNAGRVFNDITPLQLAMWLLDTHVVNMIRECLTPDAIKLQIEEHYSADPKNSPSYILAHGQHFDLSSSLNNFEKISSPNAQEIHHYQAAIKSMSHLPVHMIHEFIDVDFSNKLNAQFSYTKLSPGNGLRDATKLYALSTGFGKQVGLIRTKAGARTIKLEDLTKHDKKDITAIKNALQTLGETRQKEILQIAAHSLKIEPSTKNTK